MSTVFEKRDARVPQLRKLYYSIGEAADATGVPPHVLRYWESEFPQLHPKKGRGGNRLYTEHDIALLARIQDLLHNKKFTIAGARKQLELGLDDETPKTIEPGDVLAEVKRELREILALMDMSGRGAAR
ncbi:MAG: MerR family transcriptional regulator [bacterium]|nr:MerR family transcriptional regulator [bacterium]MBK8130470.1 MerR family transcriptional regulator [bacterium]